MVVVDGVSVSVHVPPLLMNESLIFEADWLEEPHPVVRKSKDEKSANDSLLVFVGDIACTLSGSSKLPVLRRAH